MQAAAGVDPWLITGLVVGGVAVVVIAGAFLASERLLPGPRDGESRSGVDRGEARRRQEIRYYLSAIDEPYEEDVAVAGHDVAFFLSDRDVAVTFDARAFLGLRDTDYYPVLCEHEMPGTHLGERLPFETPTIGVEDDTREHDRNRRNWGSREPAGGRSAESGTLASAADRERVGASFALLGLGTDASEREVKEAYRRRVKETHPDQGGDEESFRRLRDAYDVAKDHAD